VEKLAEWRVPPGGRAPDGKSFGVKKVEGLWLGALGACGGWGLRVDEVGGVVAAGFAAIDAKTITCFRIMLYDAAFAASAVGLA
jgi:hypothetical protein